MKSASSSDRGSKSGCSLAAVSALAGEGAKTQAQSLQELKDLGSLVKSETTLLPPFNDDAQELVKRAQVLKSMRATARMRW
jgi:pyruvate-formate lyase-activating enzyme